MFIYNMYIYIQLNKSYPILTRPPIINAGTMISGDSMTPL